MLMCTQSRQQGIGFSLLQTWNLAWRTGPSARLLPSHCSCSSSQASLILLHVPATCQIALSAPATAAVSIFAVRNAKCIHLLTYFVYLWPTHEPHFRLNSWKAVGLCLLIVVAKPMEVALLDDGMGKMIQEMLRASA